MLKTTKPAARRLSRRRILEAGAGTAAEIGARVKAGTNCGSCIPELNRLIAEAGGAGAKEAVFAGAAS
ncbi:bacterioferritin-associated ferredoxin [Bradyrhizobium sp.]|uniref:(2Fe-2S)-binding protein n=1 Tax=Bradyrhizobium sp. TaxID=376 RepID=UPI00261F9D91|nr:(2Fe-2S)-binding protein [Bradyrhizobium sp.]